MRLQDREELDAETYCIGSFRIYLGAQLGLLFDYKSIKLYVFHDGMNLVQELGLTESGFD